MPPGPRWRCGPRFALGVARVTLRAGTWPTARAGRRRTATVDDEFDLVHVVDSMTAGLGAALAKHRASSCADCIDEPSPLRIQERVQQRLPGRGERLIDIQRGRFPRASYVHGLTHPPLKNLVSEPSFEKLADDCVLPL